MSYAWTGPLPNIHVFINIMVHTDTNRTRVSPVLICPSLQSTLHLVVGATCWNNDPCAPVGLVYVEAAIRSPLMSRQENTSHRGREMAFLSPTFPTYSSSPSLSLSLSLSLPPYFFLLTLNPGNICNLVHGQGRMFTKALGPLLVYLEGRQSGSLSKCSRIVIQCRVVSWTVLYGLYSERLSMCPSSWCHLSCGTQ